MNPAEQHRVLRKSRRRRQLLCAAATGHWVEEPPPEPVPQRPLFRWLLAAAFIAFFAWVALDHRSFLFTDVRSRPSAFRDALMFSGFGLLMVWSANYARRHHWRFSLKNPLLTARSVVLAGGLMLGLSLLFSLVAYALIVLLACCRIL